jgi:SAM-dependent methyltransferase
MMAFSFFCRHTHEGQAMMTNPGYDYYGMLASTWDLWRDNTADWADRHFFLELVRTYGERVLDIGCGTGRLVLDYATLGVDVDGIDNSPEMLEICRSKAEKLGVTPGIYLLDILRAELPRQYRTILAPSSVLQLMTAPGAAREMLARCYTHLEPGGVFASPFSFDWRPGDPLQTGWGLVFEKVRPDDGATVRRWTRETHDPAQQLWGSENRYEVEVDGQIVATEEQRQSPEGRWYTQEQAVALLREVGFDEIQVYEGFSFAPATAEARLFSLVGVKG